MTQGRVAYYHTYSFFLYKIKLYKNTGFMFEGKIENYSKFSFWLRIDIDEKYC